MTTGDKVVRIAVDAMGGDNAPAAIIEGAVAAAKEGGIQIMLVGDMDIIQPELAKHDADKLPIALVPSEGVVVEGEQPARSLRQKPRASILVATGIVKQGHADASVSMGSTGAAMAAAAFVLGTIEGIDRPTLGGPVIGVAPHTLILDLGTNLDCRPSQLLSFAVIGDVYVRQFWNIERPRVAILSVGSEAGKGNRQVHETSELLEQSGLNFIGNVEGNDLPQGKADVVVCDGFVGNIVMKLTEGLGQVLTGHMRKRLEGKLSPADLEQVAKELYDINNVVEMHGGGPILGVNGVSIVGHGSADAAGVQRAIRTAKTTVDIEFISKLNEALGKVRAKVGDDS